MKKIINTEKAPAAIGPYSQAIYQKPFLFVSGQLPMDAKTGEIVENDIRIQTEQCIKNLIHIVEAAGGSCDSVLKTTVYLKDMNMFSAMNEVYNKTFKASLPARAAVEVARLPKDVLVEIEGIASINEEEK